MNKVAFISAFVPSIEKEERPRKKLRPAASLNTITVLNDCGIAAYLIGNYEEAEKLFSQALCRIDVRFLCASIQSSLDIFSKKQDTATAWKQVDCPDTQKVMRSIDLKGEDSIQITNLSLHLSTARVR
jgi:tetratricopeptide (TPR) repeat protein